jgi:hypothetical protein
MCFQQYFIATSKIHIPGIFSLHYFAKGWPGCRLQDHLAHCALTSLQSGLFIFLARRAGRSPRAWRSIHFEKLT